MKNKLLKVAEGIMDKAASEYRQENLQNWESVFEYAANGMEIILTKHESELILLVCLRWIEKTENGELSGTNDYYWSFERILMDKEEISL